MVSTVEVLGDGERSREGRRRRVRGGLEARDRIVREA